jgi:hypothetical protein
MTALVVALLIAGIDPGPKLSDADDFREMVAAFEEQTGCEAVSLFRCREEDYRIVVFRCGGFDAAVIYERREEGDWVFLRRALIRTARRGGELGI